MKAVLAWSLLLLAGSVSCTPVQEKTVNLPEWVQVPEWLPELIGNLPDKPDWVQIPEWIPDLIGNLPDKPEIEKPEWWPDQIPSLPEISWPPQKPEWWPDQIPSLPEISWPPQKPEWWPEIELPEITINKAVPGTPATVEQFPGIVQVEFGSGPLWFQGCAASVLTSLHVLSAARCFSGRDYHERFRRIRAGSSSRYADGSLVAVDRVDIHPDFDSSNDFMDSDIVVVRLNAFLVFGSTIQQTPIVPAGFNVGNGLPLLHAGWGSTSQGSKIGNRDLHSIDLVSVGHAECNELWRSMIPVGPIVVTANQICAARPETGGRNADFRDIGAPIFFSDILVGVVSFGAKGNQKFPVVATSVGSFTNWIIEKAV